MKEVFQQYATYNAWANEKIAETIKALPSNLIDKTVESSFSSLRLTILHMWEADHIWYQRLNLTPNAVSFSKDKGLPGDFILDKWKQQSLQLRQWVEDAEEVSLTNVFAYNNTKGEQFKQPVFQVLLHIFNHATYHRGQLVTILRQLGVQEIPATDFIVWSR